MEQGRNTCAEGMARDIRYAEITGHERITRAYEASREQMTHYSFVFLLVFCNYPFSKWRYRRLWNITFILLIINFSA
jgi:hypothetical protein